VNFEGIVSRLASQLSEAMGGSFVVNHLQRCSQSINEAVSQKLVRRTLEPVGVHPGHEVLVNSPRNRFFAPELLITRENPQDSWLGHGKILYWKLGRTHYLSHTSAPNSRFHAEPRYFIAAWLRRIAQWTPV